MAREMDSGPGASRDDGGFSKRRQAGNGSQLVEEGTGVS